MRERRALLVQLVLMVTEETRDPLDQKVHRDPQGTRSRDQLDSSTEAGMSLST